MGAIEAIFKKEIAAIRTVWMDQRMHVVVSEMTNRDDLRENIAGSQNVAARKTSTAVSAVVRVIPVAVRAATRAASTAPTPPGVGTADPIVDAAK